VLTIRYPFLAEILPLLLILPVASLYSIKDRSPKAICFVTVFFPSLLTEKCYCWMHHWSSYQNHKSLYVSSLKTKEKISQTGIAQAAGVTEVTMVRI
jgi:transcription initiation factor TFIIIB Brf1 subunit/transcription initiation factor TFIIB